MRSVLLCLAAFIVAGCNTPNKQLALSICLNLEGLDETTLASLDRKPLTEYGKVGDGPYTSKMFHDELHQHEEDFYWCNYQIENPDENPAKDVDSIELLYMLNGFSEVTNEPTYDLFLSRETRVDPRGGTVFLKQTRF